LVTLGKWYNKHVTSQRFNIFNGQGEALFIRSFEKSRGYGPLVDASNPLQTVGKLDRLQVNMMESMDIVQAR